MDSNKLSKNMKIYTCINKVNQLLDLPCVEQLEVYSKTEINKKKYLILNRQRGLEQEKIKKH